MQTIFFFRQIDQHLTIIDDNPSEEIEGERGWIFSSFFQDTGGGLIWVKQTEGEGNRWLDGFFVDYGIETWEGCRRENCDTDGRIPSESRDIYVLPVFSLQNHCWENYIQRGLNFIIVLKKNVPENLWLWYLIPPNLSLLIWRKKKCYSPTPPLFLEFKGWV